MMAFTNRGENPFSLSPFGPSFMPQIMRLLLMAAQTLNFPKLAEYRDGTYEPSPDFADTGSTLGALLPISDVQNSQTLRNYTGRATVMDARVICTRPNSQIHSTVTFSCSTAALPSWGIHGGSSHNWCRTSTCLPSWISEPDDRCTSRGFDEREQQVADGGQ